MLVMVIKLIDLNIIFLNYWIIRFYYLIIFVYFIIIVIDY